jgi:hypothetical protein
LDVGRGVAVTLSSVTVLAGVVAALDPVGEDEESAESSSPPHDTISTRPAKSIDNGKKALIIQFHPFVDVDCSNRYYPPVLRSGATQGWPCSASAGDC